MKLCSECKEPILTGLSFSEDGAEEELFCQLCVDYVDTIEVPDEEECN